MNTNTRLAAGTKMTTTAAGLGRGGWFGDSRGHSEAARHPDRKRRAFSCHSLRAALAQLEWRSVPLSEVGNVWDDPPRRPRWPWAIGLVWLTTLAIGIVVALFLWSSLSGTRSSHSDASLQAVRRAEASHED